MAGSSLLHVLALICPFIMKNVNDQMALAIDLARASEIDACVCSIEQLYPVVLCLPPLLGPDPLDPAKTKTNIA